MAWEKDPAWPSLDGLSSHNYNASVFEAENNLISDDANVLADNESALEIQGQMLYV